MSDYEPNFELPKNMDRCLAMLSKVYEAEDNWQLQKIIVNSKIRIDEAYSYDNWNGGTYGHALYLVLPKRLFSFTLKQTLNIQEKVKKDLNQIRNFPNEFVEKVFLELDVDEGVDWRKDSGLHVSEEKTVPADAEKRIWGERDHFRIFLSHVSKSKVEAAELKARLQLFGASCFVAHQDIEPETEWQNEIEVALASMHGFVVLLTDAFHESNWTDQEVGFALARRVPRVAVRLGTDPYGFIGKFQALAGSPWKDCPVNIVKRFIKEDRMCSAYLRAVKECPSYDAGNVLAGVFPAIERIPKNQIDELVAAFNRNFELRRSYGFNGIKPKEHGPGLLWHLNRLGPRTFGRVSGLIEEMV
jgi:TIR domain